MTFNTNRFTPQSVDVISASQKIAERNSNSQVEPEHLLLALLEQGDRVMSQILNKMNIAIGALAQQVRAELSRLPRVSSRGMQVGLSNRLRTVLVRAHDELAQFGDEYISTEHLLLAILAHAGGAAQRLLQQAGLNRDALLAARRDVRGLQRITSPNSEGIKPWRMLGTMPSRQKPRTPAAHIRATGMISAPGARRAA